MVTVDTKEIICRTQLHDGVLSHAAARRMEKGGWVLEEGLTESAEVNLDAGRVPDELAVRLQELVDRVRISWSVQAGAAAARRLEFGDRESFQQWASEKAVDFFCKSTRGARSSRLACRQRA